MSIFLKSVGGIIVVTILAAVILVFLGWSRVPDMLADHLTEKMGVSVHIDDVRVSMNDIKIEKLDIGNTPGSILPKAFSAQEITIKAPLLKYTDTDIVIEEVHIDNIYLGLEFDSISGTEGNWTRIMQNLQQSMTTESESTKRTVLIKKIILTNISTDLVYHKGSKGVKHLPMIARMELDNISTEGGFPVDQIANSVLGQMLKEIFVRENLKNMLNNMIKEPFKTPGKAVKTFKGLFGL
jgi:uncharacterized protein involved in outer membrane biogenesis